jgi:hypothetical protein
LPFIERQASDYAEFESCEGISLLDRRKHFNSFVSLGVHHFILLLSSRLCVENSELTWANPPYLQLFVLCVCKRINVALY